MNHGFEEGSVFGPSVRPFSCSYVAALKSSHAQNRNPFAHTNANNNVCTLNCVCSLCARFRDVHGAWLNTSEAVNVVLDANVQRAALSLMKMASGVRYAPPGLSLVRLVKIGIFFLCSALGLRQD